ncbi:helix-turn-helix domain-containing protein [Hymenobacter saemangeumensis]
MVDRIRLILQARQLSPTQFADAIGAARPVISHILSGRNKPSLEVVQKILAAFPELSMAWLLNGIGEMTLGTAAADAESPSESAPAPVSPPAAPTQGQAPSPAPPRRASRPVPDAAETVPVAPKPRKTSPMPPLQRFTGGSGPAIPVPEPTAPPRLNTSPAAPVEAVPRETEPLPGALTAQAMGQPTANALMASAEKPIRRIVIFYQDGSFADFRPE